MSRGRRYETEGKLNYQKVFAVIIAIIVIAMVVMIIKNVFIQREKLKNMNTLQHFQQINGE